MINVSSFPSGPTQTQQRANWFASNGGIDAIEKLNNIIKLPFSETLLLGLLRQGISKYLMILGHGSTQIGETLRAYENAKLVKSFQFRNEVEMAHAGTALSWVYNEGCAVITSIGPGALQAMAGSLVASSNSVGIYYIFGDETTWGEGYNMQQIPKTEQGSFNKMTSIMGDSYCFYEPQSLREGLRRGASRVFHPIKPGPFYLNIPINVQPTMVDIRLDSLPETPIFNCFSQPRTEAITKAHQWLKKYQHIAIKVGGGGCKAAKEIEHFASLIGGVVVLSPGSTGVLTDDHPQNMHVGGSKGTISGNWAMQNADLVIFIGSRGVCQSDCSGVGWPNAKAVININPDNDDVQHYNNTLAFNGFVEDILPALTQELNSPIDKSEWLNKCFAQKQKWQEFKKHKFEVGTIYDEVWQQKVMTQPQIINIADKFAKQKNALKFFDAGDVQATGFQTITDNQPFETFTESGSSYMGFSVSALIAGGITETDRFAIAFTGDGSFMMNPQILIDGVLHGVYGTILLLDNRRMAAISSLQQYQYGKDYKTADFIEVDYKKMAASVTGVKSFWGGTSKQQLLSALDSAYAYKGLSLIHVPVYYGDHQDGTMGAYGEWNVGNWCQDVQQKYANNLI